jgi:nitrogen regulatory protein P-II 1
MKRIEAFIQINKLESVRTALDDAGVQGITVENVQGYGRQMGRTPGSSPTPRLLAKTKVEVVVPDELLDSAIQAIISSAQTGEIGDGKIFVSEVVEAIRIRTGERGDAALN